MTRLDRLPDAMNEVCDVAERFGLIAQQTGGGCTALVQELGAGPAAAYLYITERDAASIPVSVDSEMDVGMYDAEGTDLFGGIYQVQGITRALDVAFALRILSGHASAVTLHTALSDLLAETADWQEAIGAERPSLMTARATAAAALESVK